jgi:cytochrome b6
VGTAIAGAVPGIGKYALLMARGGEDITGDTLARFYALHVVILPLATIGLIGLHLFLVQKHGISSPEGVIRKHGGEERVPYMPFVPHFLLRDMVGWYLALGILAALAALFPWELGHKADPFGSAPAGIKPEWYFLFMFQALKQLPANLGGIEWLEGEMVGVLFFGFCGLVVLLVPYVDFGASRGRPRWVLNFLAALAVGFFIFMTAWGLR